MADTIKIKAKKGYTVLQNDLILDCRLSLKTKGLMAVMLSRPDDWEFSVSGLAAFCQCGKDSIRGALKELEAAGYLTRQQIHGTGGTFAGNLYEIHDSSSSPLSENPTTEKPSSEKPSSENPTQRNKDLKKEGLKESPHTPQGGASVSLPKWDPQGFEKFWAYYTAHARGEKRLKAVEAWDKLKPDAALKETMGRALMAQVKSDDWRRGFAIPYASTWINQRRWEDVAAGSTAAPPPDERRLQVWE